jgi:hypothetical protein
MKKERVRVISVWVDRVQIDRLEVALRKIDDELIPGWTQKPDRLRTSISHFCEMALEAALEAFEE